MIIAVQWSTLCGQNAPLELMFEGHDTRWEDLTRWDKVQEQYDRLALKSYVLSF